MALNQTQIKNLFRPFNTYLALVVSIVLFSLNGSAQNSFLSGWNIGAKFGASRMIGEFPNNFSEAITEFDYKMGFAIDAELSKTISNHFEIGFDINRSTLTGETQNPSFSAQGYHAAFMEPLTAPVEFENKLSGQKFFFRYYFKDLEETEGFKFNPFVRAGVGFLHYNSKVKYIDAPDDDLLFGKGNSNYSNELSTAVYVLGTGFKTEINKRFYLLASADLNFVNYDFLDVVHNYNENGDRLELLGIYSDFKIGIFYNITSNKPGKGRSKKSAIQQYLPFGR